MNQTEISPLHERIGKLESALRAVVEAHRLMGWQVLPERTLDLAIKKAEKVLNDKS